ncbi:inhibitor of KinA [Propionispira arboris]|uniref:Inhibitor of KinA n=1 Tax=Propionispira arboris TaxID=84035 RepID=A0A1H6WSD7_9FIRM|nr:5-oxoprolinase subunit PxpB [Propionispira arboris]SEJ19899.1 inhibitor of KinA [Propionispira arboris]
MGEKNIEWIEMFPLGETGITVSFGKGIHPDIHYKVKAFADYLEKHSFTGMIEYISSFCSITVYYDSLQVRTLSWDNIDTAKPISYQIVEQIMLKFLNEVDLTVEKKADIVRIPVCYGGEFGQDLEYVASYHKLSVQNVIDIHTSSRYLVYMIGFAPGFPYVGGMSPQIATPRRSSPRLSIPKGSVGIAGTQTGVYPIETPGGWQLIGRTPLALFQPDSEIPSLLQAGDIIEFYSISYEEYQAYEKGGLS